MNIKLLLDIIAAGATAITGLFAFIKPSATFSFIGLKAEGVRGISEIRAIFGGLFIALGILPFFLGEKAFLMLGYSYLMIALTRLISIIIDKSYAKSNWISLVIEIALGVILVI